MLFAVALTFLLGFSQQSAMLHSISHLAELDPVSNQLAQEQQDQGTHQASHCDHCLGFSHLANIITSNNGLSFAATPQVSPDNLAPTSKYHLTSLAYNARAPPASI